MSLTSIVTGLQGLVGLGGILGGAGAVVKSPRWLGGSLMGGGFVLFIQSIIQCQKISNDSNFSLSCNRISCLTLASLLNGAVWACACSLPEKDGDAATALGLSGLLASVLFVNAEDLKHVSEKCFRIVRKILLEENPS